MEGLQAHHQHELICENRKVVLAKGAGLFHVPIFR